MKRLLLTLFLALMVLGPAMAQIPGTEVEIYQSVLGMEKRLAVEDFMQLNKGESDAFWEVYNQFETERKELGKERLTLLTDYVNSYAKMSQEKAHGLMGDIFKLGAKQDKLIKKYYKKMKKATSAKTAAQWVQTEQYILTVIRLELMETFSFCRGGELGPSS